MEGHGRVKGMGAGLCWIPKATRATPLKRLGQGFCPYRPGDLEGGTECPQPSITGWDIPHCSPKRP